MLLSHSSVLIKGTFIVLTMNENINQSTACWASSFHTIQKNEIEKLNRYLHDDQINQSIESRLPNE